MPMMNPNLTDNPDKNIRVYPIRADKTQSKTPIVLPPLVRSVDEDEWESDDIVVYPQLSKQTQKHLTIINNNIHNFPPERNWFDEYENKPENQATIITSFNWIVPNYIALGSHPLRSPQISLNILKEHNIRAIVSVFEQPIEKEQLSGLDYLHIPTIKGYSNSLLEACKFIEKMENEDKPVYIHSLSGVGRAATVMGAYFIYKNWLTSDEAIVYLRNKFDVKAVETKYQEDQLHTFAMSL